MKNKILIFTLLLLSISVYTQKEEYKFSGMVLELKTNKPITDVILLLNNNQVGYTNEKGQYSCKLFANENDTIVFYHSAYFHKKVLISQLNTETIKLTEKTILLEEIEIGIKRENIKEVKRKLHRSFQKNFRKVVKKTPYWSKINLKQVTVINDTLPAYLEIDGDLLMYGNSYTNVWDSPILIPKKSRRTVENFIKHDGLFFNDLRKAKVHNHYAITNLCYEDLIAYQFFEVSHPLISKGLNLYNFTFEKTINIKGQEYYVLSFTSKKEKTKIKGRNFYGIRGQLIINKENLILKKITAYYRMEGIKTIFTAEYQLVNKALYPKSISYNLSFILNKNKIVRKGLFSFKEINPKELDNPRNIITGNRFLFSNSEIYNNYEAKYWGNRSLLTSNLGYEIKEIFRGKISDTLFSQGASQKISTTSKYVTEENKILKLKNEHEKNK
jgi:hypothetical protein